MMMMLGMDAACAAGYLEASSCFLVWAVQSATPAVRSG